MFTRRDGSLKDMSPLEAIASPLGGALISQPVNRTVTVRGSASFTVTTTGYPLDYQWRKDGVNLAGARNATYSFLITQTNQGAVTPWS